METTCKIKLVVKKMILVVVLDFYINQNCVFP